MFGYKSFNLFSMPLEMMWFAIQPKGCRLTILLAPQLIYEIISAGSSHPSPNCAFKVMTLAASSASSKMSLNGIIYEL